VTDAERVAAPVSRRNWERVWSIVRPHRGRVLVLSVMSLLGGVVEALFLVIITRAALAIADGEDDFGVLAGRSASLAAGIAVGALLLVIRLILGLAAVRVSAELCVAVLTDARHRLSDAYLHTSWAVQHAEPSGWLHELLGGFAGVASGVATSLSLALIAILNIAALIAVSLTINPTATLVVVVAILALGAVIGPLRRRLRARASAAAAAQMSIATTVSELGTLGMEMQSFGVRDQFAERVREVVAHDSIARRRVFVVQGALSPLYTFLAYGALLGGLGLAAAFGTGELGGAAAVMLVMLRTLSYGQQVQTSMGSLSTYVPYLDVLDETIERYSLERAPGGDRSIDSVGPLEVRSVTFAYDPGIDVLRDVSFAIHPGETVGMIGPSGSGKSTLVQLLLGLREPTSGTVEADGVDIREIDRRSWTARTAFVAQDALLISGSIAENIAFFRSHIDRDAITRAARQAHILDEILAMPEGFDSAVGERGGNLSGGQRQRISIARALAGNPELLVMDEPTSALDARSESLIRRTITDLEDRVTVIIIAHRMSTLDVCDRIMVLRDGVLKAMDTPAWLAENDPLFQESLQLSGLTS